MRNDIHLRKLEEKDAEGMYEWMHDKDADRGFRKKLFETTMDDIMRFIQAAQDVTENLNYAICNDEDEYLGTISLKNINHVENNAEFAIALRKKARGCGVGESAIKQLLTIAFNDMGLVQIYLNVLAENERAIGLYKKCGFSYVKDSEEIFEKFGEKRRLLWFVINANNDNVVSNMKEEK